MRRPQRLENYRLFAVKPGLSLVLASASPRRQKFLASLGLSFAIHPVANEPKPQNNIDPHIYVAQAARAKALACLAEYPKSSAIIGADTIVVFDGQILGKPQNSQEALAMLLAQNGKTSMVISSAHLILPDGAELSLVDQAHVIFGQWPPEVITAYALSREPLDKAGAFAIQENGSFLIDRIEGNYLTIVGIPGPALVHALLENGIIQVVQA